MNGLVKEGSIGEVLFKAQIITEDNLRAALEEQKISGCRIGEILVKQGVVTQEDIDWALANQLKIPYVRLKKEAVDKDAALRIPATLARRFNLIPLFLVGNELSIAIADPLNTDAIREVAETTGCQVTVSVGLIREIREMQDLFYGPTAPPTTLDFTSPHFTQAVLDSINSDLTGGKLLDYLLLIFMQRNLSALSLQPLGETVLISAKSSGETQEIGRLAGNNYPGLLCRIKKLAKLESCSDIAAHGVLAFKLKEKIAHFQILMLRAVGGEYVTIKLHFAAPFPQSSAELELSAAKALSWKSLTTPGQGMVLFFQHDTDERCHFMDLFLDECATDGKTVMLLGERLGRGTKNFPRIPVRHFYGDDTQSLLMAALEHDPDIIAIEDITEGPAFIAASKAVMRGKMVVAGISLGNKAEVLKHLLYFKQKNYVIPTHIRGIISCRGVLTLCPRCRQQYTPHPDEIAALRLPGTIPGYFRAVGCPDCDHTGYTGRKYLLDIIPFGKEVLEALEIFHNGAEIIRHLKDNGYRGITEEGIELLRNGAVTPGEFVASLLL
jgi:type II secretory ATPase GspE/PulE/Tfp pilus assembly ATPase PilB-like protein